MKIMSLNRMPALLLFLCVLNNTPLIVALLPESAIPVNRPSSVSPVAQSEFINRSSTIEKTPIEQSTTLILLEEMRKNRESVTLSQSKSPIFGRPTDPGGDWPIGHHFLPQLYNTTHFVLHWTNGSDGGDFLDAPPLNDTNGDGFPDFINQTAEIFEQVRDFQINQRGFLAPPSDEERPNDVNQSNPDGRYDVFILNVLKYGYLGLCYPEGEVNGSWYSYIVVENNFGPPLPWEMPALDQMRAVAAHEFFHAIQFTYDFFDEAWWMETTATYMEDEVYPDVNHNYNYLPDFFLWPDRGLENTTGLHEYGNFIFAKFLSESFGDGIIKEICEEMNNTDGLVAIDEVLNRNNSSLFAVFDRFITANFFLEEMYVDGTDYREALRGKIPFDGVWIEYQYDASVEGNNTEINATNVNWDTWMDKWGTDYITLNLDPTKPRYRIFFDGLDDTTNYLVKLATKKAGNITERKFQLNASKDGYLDLSYDDFDNVTVIIANAGNTTTSNPSWRVTITFTQPPPPSITVEPQLIYEPIHNNFALNISITHVFNLWRFELKLYWNTSVLDYINATPKLLWTSSNVSHNQINETEGYYWLAVEGIEPSAPFSGNATLATITFNCTGIGESPLELRDTSLEHKTGEPIIHRLQAGYFKALFHDIAVTDVRLSSAMVEPGEFLAINATVENQGDFTETFNVTAYANTTAIEVQEVTVNLGESIILSFTWNTTQVPLGNYTISATTGEVPGEIDTEDNSFIDGIVTVLVYSHDVSIIGGGPELPRSGIPILCLGYTLPINITVQNQGDIAETFNATVYINGTEIETKRVSLAAGEISTITFRWNSTGYQEYQNYTISVYIPLVPGETDMLDNNYTVSNAVLVTMVGDINGDREVDIRDIASIARSYGSKQGDSRYSANNDLDRDGSIDIRDVASAARHFGEVYRNS